MNVLKEVLVDLAKLKLPVTATAGAVFIITELPGTHLQPEAVAGALMGVGLAASLIQKLLEKKAPTK